MWLLATFFLIASPAEAQPQGKVYQVGVMTVGTPVLQIKGVRDGLKEAGYTEGKNLVLNVLAKKTYEELRPIAKAYIAKNFDALVTMGGTATLIAKESTQEIPIVFIGAADPVGSGFLKSFSRPEANLTGVAGRSDLEMHGKRLQTLKEVVPALRRVTVLYNARGENPIHEKSLALIQKIAPTLRLKLAEKPIKHTADIEETLSSVSKSTTDGLFSICATLFRDYTKQMIAVAIEKRLALMVCGADSTEQGSLLSYGSDTYRLGQRGAWYIDRILKGTKPQDLPVESPTYFQLVINLKTAKQIGLTIPPNVLARADRVIR
jgi:putative ABC transport system substrate-binding protein